MSMMEFEVGKKIDYCWWIQVVPKKFVLSAEKALERLDLTSLDLDYVSLEESAHGIHHVQSVLFLLNSSISCVDFETKFLPVNEDNIEFTHFLS